MSGGLRRLIGAIVVLLVVAAAVTVIVAVGRQSSGGSGAVPPSDKRAGPDAIYPNPSLTPGDVLAGVTAAQVCKPGYSSSVRNVSTATKREAFQRYGIVYTPGAYEVDHFISLELGGSNEIANLWPERYSPAPGAHEKDKVENYLHDQMCKGAMTLQQAQDQIRRDWYAVYQQIGGR